MVASVCLAGCCARRGAAISSANKKRGIRLTRFIFISIIHHWLLGIGYWALAIGHWLFGSVSPTALTISKAFACARFVRLCFIEPNSPFSCDALRLGSLTPMLGRFHIGTHLLYQTSEEPSRKQAYKKPCHNIRYYIPPVNIRHPDKAAERIPL